MRTLAVVLTIAVGAGGMAAGQIPRPETPQSLILRSTVGAELYKFYCSSCHGLDAKGRPTSATMRVAAPDLTTLQQANNGVFPRERIEAILAHGTRATASHGGKDMPVWGAIFRGLEPSDTEVQVRIRNLIEYLESLQEGAGRRPAN